MRNALFLLSLLVITAAVSSQTPGLQWQRTLGGNDYDHATHSLKANDNGIIHIGWTYSSDDIFTSNHGDADIWVEKLSSTGVTQWRRILGGSGKEQPFSYHYNADGSVVVLCTTTSTNGDITNNHGASDIWIFKLDNNGSTVWQRCFGGTNNEFASKIIKSADGNYIVSGGTMSTNNGDVTGFQGLQDAWVLKISETGTLVWQRSLGGSNYEDPNGKISEAADGSIYLLTDTRSNDGHVSGNHGGITQTDLWLVKLSSVGTTLWSHCYGGSSFENSSDIRVSSTNEVYVLGHTRSPGLPSFHGITTDYYDFYVLRISAAGVMQFQKCFGGTLDDEAFKIVSIETDGSAVIGGQVNNGGGDVVGYHGSASGTDLWIISVDLTGNIVWQKALGGFYHDKMSDTDMMGESGTGTVIKTADNGFLVTGFTESVNGDVVGYHQPSPSDSSRTDIWVAKLSPAGALEWTRSLGGKRAELPRSVFEMSSNNYIITGISNSRDGDLQTNNGYYDAWIVKLGAINKIKGIVYVDQNSNGIKDATDSLYSNVTIQTTKPGLSKTTIPYKGEFLVETDTGSFTTTLTALYPYYTAVPTSHPSSFTTYFNTDSFSFALQPIPNLKDLVIHAIPLTPARPGFDLKHSIQYKNAGTVSIPSGQVFFIKDPKLNFVSAVPPVSSVSGDTLKWDYINLNPLESRTILLATNLPASVALGDSLISKGLVTPDAFDITPQDDTIIVRQRVIGSYDPNDKTENRAGLIRLEEIVNGEYINYTIRFQNTGTDTAFNVVVRDTIDTRYDISTFQMIAASHLYQLNITDGNKVEWVFGGINLPDSDVNEPASHGYISFRVKAIVNGTFVGYHFLNDASIYFDFNAPVVTNTSDLLVFLPMVLPLHLQEFTAKYQQPDAILEWKTSDEMNVSKFEIERGTDPYHFTKVGTVAAGATNYQFKDGLAHVSGDKFYYRLKMVDIDEKYTFSNIQLVRKEGKIVNELLVNPNPVKGSVAFAWINFEKATAVELGVFDILGHYRLLFRKAINKGFNIIPIELNGLKPGTYILRAKMDGKLMVTRFVIAP